MGRQSTRQEAFPVGTVMLTFVLIMVMYIYTYNRQSSALWLFFILERVISYSYDDPMNQYMDSLGDDDHNAKKNLWIMAIFSLISIGFFIYIPFKYPGLFMIVILGEIIDLILKLVRRKMRGKLKK